MFASAEEEGNKSRFNSYSVRNIAFPTTFLEIAV